MSVASSSRIMGGFTALKCGDPRLHCIPPRMTRNIVILSRLFYYCHSWTVRFENLRTQFGNMPNLSTFLAICTFFIWQQLKLLLFWFCTGEKGRCGVSKSPFSERQNKRRKILLPSVFWPEGGKISRLRSICRTILRDRFRTSGRFFMKRFFLI